MSDTPKPAIHIVHGEIHDCMPLATYLRLERELAALLSDIERHVAITASQAEEIAGLRAENERLREDAGRYRWLRDFSLAQKEMRVCVMQVAVSDQLTRTGFLHGEEMDFAIDAARKEGK